MQLGAKAYKSALTGTHLLLGREKQCGMKYLAQGHNKSQVLHFTTGRNPPKSPIQQGSLSSNWREHFDKYMFYPDKGSLTSSVLNTDEKVSYCIGHRPPDDGYCNQLSHLKSDPVQDKT